MRPRFRLLSLSGHIYKRYGGPLDLEMRGRQDLRYEQRLGLKSESGAIKIAYRPALARYCSDLFRRP